ncbi:putative F-box protein at1g49610 [Phtheirospermum japonicum]|uniref:Putative F-box protein at1g49610 n=1 Tax=Phtheirospermum japonicum TaxID=374723 RepID=A0A830B089_9LAMI|nr:putative F-box protein at1g49610 [Phtheirospermum japonicum]
MSSNKLIKETPVDRLSALPDSLIIRILSFLEVKESAITAVLSKRWQFLWTETPNLIFTEDSFRSDKIRNFVSRVNRTLLVISGSRNGLGIFAVEFPYDDMYSSDIDVWVDFAVKKRVKGVCLLFNCLSSTNLYLLPRMMFHNPYLERLMLRRCVVAPRRTIDWRSLTELQIERSELQQHVIDKILSGCPVLYRLVLKCCWGFNRLEVDSKSVYKLAVCDPEDGVDEPLLQISAPYLHTLWVCLHAEGRKLRLKNISSLVRATIDIHVSDWNIESEEVVNHVKELLGNIRHVKVVETGDGYSQILPWMALDGCRFPQSDRTCLIVNALVEKLSIYGILRLLESSPNLEALVIEGLDFYDEPISFPDKPFDLDCDLLHLKTITINDFIDSDLVGEPMLSLARILLKRTPALEKMVVHIEGIGVTSSLEHTVSEPFKILQALLSYPRSSNKAVVLIS